MEAKVIVGSARPRVAQNENTKLGIYNYDEDNMYPQRMQVLSSASGTTRRCLRTYERFLKGNGFADNTFYKKKVNRQGMRMDALLLKNIKDFVLLRGMALHISYNMSYEKAQWRYVPFANCRLCNEDYEGKIAVYDDWAKQKRKRIDPLEIDYIDVFNPDPNIIQGQIDIAGGPKKWKGQILWISEDDGNYPLATIDPVIEDVQSDAETKHFRYRSLTSNFMPSHLLTTDPAENQAKADDFANNLKNFQGAKNSNKILWVQKRVKDQTVELQKFDIQDTDKMYEVTTRTVKDSIIENFGIPSIINNVRVPGELGNDAKKLKDATDFYNSLTDIDRIFVSEFYQMAFENTGMNPSEDYSIIPVIIPVTLDNAPVESIKSVTEIMSNTALSVTQKRAALKILFGMADADINQLVPQTTV